MGQWKQDLLKRGFAIEFGNDAHGAHACHGGRVARQWRRCIGNSLIGRCWS